MRLLRLLPWIIALASIDGAWASDATVRIGFLLNFSRFTEWPEQALMPAKPITFCLAPGDVEMAAEFATLERQTVQNRPVKTMQVARSGDVTRCHVLYLPADIPGGPEPWLASAERSGILTVSDHPDFVDKGGIIGMVLLAGRYRFNVNLVQAKRGNLFLGANLLKLAHSVR